MHEMLAHYSSQISLTWQESIISCGKHNFCGNPRKMFLARWLHNIIIEYHVCEVEMSYRRQMKIIKAIAMYMPMSSSTPRTAITAPATASEFGISSAGCTAARVTPNAARIE